MNYQTEQRKLMQNLFAEHPHEMFSAKDIQGMLTNVSVSAIYRNLSELEEKGLIMRCSKSGSSKSFYTYTKSDGCREYIHLKCKQCGKTAHMPIDDTEILMRNALEHKKFKVDKTETILYGICESCQK